MSEIWPSGYDRICNDISDELNDVIPQGMVIVVQAWSELQDIWKVHDEAKCVLLDEVESILGRLFDPKTQLNIEPDLKSNILPILEKIKKLTK